MALLSAPVALHDIRDLEAHARLTLSRQLRSWQMRLSDDDFDDALSFLIELAYELEKRYDERLAGEHASFSGYFLYLARLRLVDWMRRRFFGRRAQRVGDLSLDAALPDGTTVPAGGDPADREYGNLGRLLRTHPAGKAALAIYGATEREAAAELGLTRIELRYQLACLREALTGEVDAERELLERYREAAELADAGLRPRQVGALLGVEASTAKSWADSWRRRPRSRLAAELVA